MCSMGVRDSLACVEHLEGAYAGHRAIQRRPAGKTLRVIPMWQRAQGGMALDSIINAKMAIERIEPEPLGE